jgi:hypothetical protein
MQTVIAENDPMLAHSNGGARILPQTWNMVQPREATAGRGGIAKQSYMQRQYSLHPTHHLPAQRFMCAPLRNGGRRRSSLKVDLLSMALSYSARACATKQFDSIPIAA